MNVDRKDLAVGSVFRMGEELFKKVAPGVDASVKTGELMYDARYVWISEYPAVHDEPVIVEWPVEKVEA